MGRVPVRVAVLGGRTTLVVGGGAAGGRAVGDRAVGDRAVDVERASEGAIPADPRAMFRSWPQLFDLARRLETAGADGAPLLDRSTLELPVPVPVQAFGVGLNYRDHAGEAAMDLPDEPLVFPKFSSCVVGPNEPVATRSEALDWEAELVVVIGAECFEVPAQDALSVIAGYTVGQDLSDRVVQFEGGANPQFGLGKSGPGFGPIGPWVVSADELGAAPHLDIRCEVDGHLKQSSNTEHLIFDVPALVSYLSSRVRLCPGDLVFTGTPAGIGWSRDPKELLGPGSRVDTTIAGIGTLTTRIVGR